MNLATKFESGLSYDAFLTKYGTAEHQNRWAKMHAAIKLTPAQRALLGSFTREMKVFCFAGAWCGDCVNQCPIFDHFAQATSTINIKYFDRDDNPDLGEKLSVCGGARVPVLLFVSEDNFQVGMYGDRTLSAYRKAVAKLSGESCPTGIVLPGESEQAEVVQDWLNEFERVQWILRTSGRLRKLHDD
ncbi:MAG: thioredoxin family protein [Planctomycetia bacterium]|nr:thioredoxin family protein [Planctomycetia bacterium]